MPCCLALLVGQAKSAGMRLPTEPARRPAACSSVQMQAIQSLPGSGAVHQERQPEGVRQVGAATAGQSTPAWAMSCITPLHAQAATALQANKALHTHSQARHTSQLLLQRDGRPGLPPAQRRKWPCCILLQHPSLPAVQAAKEDLGAVLECLQQAELRMGPRPSACRAVAQHEGIRALLQQVATTGAHL